MRCHQHAGFTLIELMVSVSLIAIGVYGVINLVVETERQATFEVAKSSAQKDLDVLADRLLKIMKETNGEFDTGDGGSTVIIGMGSTSETEIFSSCTTVNTSEPYYENFNNTEVQTIYSDHCNQSNILTGCGINRRPVLSVNTGGKTLAKGTPTEKNQLIYAFVCISTLAGDSFGGGPGGGALATAMKIVVGGGIDKSYLGKNQKTEHMHAVRNYYNRSSRSSVIEFEVE